MCNSPHANNQLYSFLNIITQAYLYRRALYRYTKSFFPRKYRIRGEYFKVIVLWQPSGGTVRNKKQFFVSDKVRPTPGWAPSTVCDAFQLGALCIFVVICFHCFITLCYPEPLCVLVSRFLLNLSRFHCAFCSRGRHISDVIFIAMAYWAYFCSVAG